MFRFRQLLTALRALLQRHRIESEMDTELRFHVDMEAARQSGDEEPDEDTRAKARRQFGGFEQVKEECRDALGYRWVQDLARDVRYGLRSLARSPGFTLVAVLTLALGIGANTAVFSVVKSVLLQRLPFKDPDRLVMMWCENPATGMTRDQTAPGDFFDWRRESQLFESVGFTLNSMTWSRNQMVMLDDQPIRIRGRYVTSGLLETLAVAPLLGQTIAEEDDLAGGAPTVVLSFDFWQRIFEGDPGVLGKSLQVGETSHRIVGVMPRGFRFPEDCDMWLSTTNYLTPRTAVRRDSHALWVIARLKPGVTVGEAENELSMIQGRIAEANPDALKVASAVTVVPLEDQVIGESTRPALVVLLCAVGFVLLIACANVANLMLARATARRKEIAIRTALGAGRVRVVRQLLTESLLLSLLGGVCGVVLALWAISIIRTLRIDDSVLSVNELRFDRFAEVSLDWSVLAFTLGLSVLTGLVFGLIPALQTARIDVNRVLKEESRSGSSGRTARRFGAALVVAEVALALMLLIGAGQMTQTFIGMQQIDPGLQPESVIRCEIDLEMAKHEYAGSIQDVTRQILDRIEALPDVESAGAINEGILRGSGWPDAFAVEGRPFENRSQLLRANIRVMTPGMLETLQVPLIQGRHITEDDDADSPRVLLVNEEFARRYFEGEDPIGQRLKFRAWPRFPWIEIVGVVSNVKNYRLDAEVEPEVFYSYHQKGWGGADLGPILYARTHGDPVQLYDALRHAVEGTDPAGSILVKFRTVESMLSSSASHERFRAVLLGSFTGLAVLLAAVGVYGVISYSTSQRTHEIGIRTALGAQRTDILRLVVGRGVGLGVIGVLLGLAASVAMSRVIASQLHGVVAADGVMLGTAAAVVLLVTVAASCIPARRAMSVQPMEALRES